MANSDESIFSGRKYPFIFVLSFLFICVGFLLLTNNQYSYFSISDLRRVRSVSLPTPPQPPPPPPPEVSGVPIMRPSTGVVQDDVHNAYDDSAVAELNWELCKGPTAFDFIPCLDNMKAIKALTTRRHMEHRERHCPESSPRCLVRLPEGYRVPIPWPKSRDMVRLIWYFGKIWRCSLIGSCLRLFCLLSFFFFLNFYWGNSRKSGLVKCFTSDLEISICLLKKKNWTLVIELEFENPSYLFF